MAIPYTFIQCPCSETSPVRPDATGKSEAPAGDALSSNDDDRDFDPRAPGANYSLYPLEYLMYCEDCQQIRCPRCVNEEIVTYYCPNCLFEVPSGNIKSEGNRCTRSCFQCPICIGPLTVTHVDKPAENLPNPSHLAPPDISSTGSTAVDYLLTCTYCAWTSSEIGIKFDKPGGIHSQLSKIRNGGQAKITARELRDRHKDKVRPLAFATISEDDGAEATKADVAMTVSDTKSSDLESHLDQDVQFSLLRSYYSGQLSDISAATGGIGALTDIGFSSPGSISRIMNLYTGGSLAGKRALVKNTSMSEAQGPEDGLQICQLDESDAISRLRKAGWTGAVSTEQSQFQSDSPRLVDDLRPIPVLLRTKRSRRCRICRHIITKPEAKVGNTRYRIRLVASQYMPSISIRPLAPSSVVSPSISTRTSITTSIPQGHLLTPNQPSQFILTFKNPIFEPVKVTLAAPTRTPGRFPSTVTVLCPQFTIEANTDMWDGALDDPDRHRPHGSLHPHRPGEDASAEAGKIYDRGRNWVSTVIEVVPASLRLEGLRWAKDQGEEGVDDGPLREDEDVLEIPMFVRIEWEAETQDVGTAPGREKSTKEKRELAYWCVLGMGRIARD